MNRPRGTTRSASDLDARPTARVVTTVAMFTRRCAHPVSGGSAPVVAPELEVTSRAATSLTGALR